MRKIFLGIAIAMAIALGPAWVWGTWIHSDTAAALQNAELRSELLGARAAVLDARVAIYSVNFGEASAHLENARGLLRGADERLAGFGRADEAAQVKAALAAIDLSQRRASRFVTTVASR